MKIANKLYAMILLCAVAMAACNIQESVFEYEPVPKPPKRTVDTDPDDTRAFKLHYQDSTYNEQMLGGILAEAFPVQDTVFQLLAKLNDREKLDLRLPLNASGYVSSGKYVLRNNEPEDGMNAPNSIAVSGKELTTVPYSLFALYNKYGLGGNETDKFDFTLIMEIDSMDREQHLITGFIDTLRIVSKTDPSKELLITGGEFAVFYDHYELEFDGSVESEAFGRYNGQLSTQDPQGGWAGWNYEFPDGRSFSMSWSPTTWTAENIAHFNANKGVGTFVLPFSGTSTDVDASYPLIYQDLSNKFYVHSSDIKLVLENFNEKQFAKGYLEFKAKEIDINTFTTFAPGSPEKSVKVSFAKRQLLW